MLSADSLFSGNYIPQLTHLNAAGDRLITAQNITAPMEVDDSESEPERFILVTNWFEELRERMGN